jgi:hypothetical protein
MGRRESGCAGGATDVWANAQVPARRAAIKIRIMDSQTFFINNGQEIWGRFGYRTTGLFSDGWLSSSRTCLLRRSPDKKLLPVNLIGAGANAGFSAEPNR